MKAMYCIGQPGIVLWNPPWNIDSLTHLFPVLCCHLYLVAYRGSIPRQRTPTNVYKQFIVPELIISLEMWRGLIREGKSRVWLCFRGISYSGFKGNKTRTPNFPFQKQSCIRITQSLQRFTFLEILQVELSPYCVEFAISRVLWTFIFNYIPTKVSFWHTELQKEATGLDGITIRLQTRIQDSSIRISAETLANLRFSVVFLNLFKEIPRWNFRYATIASFQILSNSLFIYHPKIWRNTL
jgi:hypothetical protein